MLLQIKKCTRLPAACNCGKNRAHPTPNPAGGLVALLSPTCCGTLPPVTIDSIFRFSFLPARQPPRNDGNNNWSPIVRPFCRAFNWKASDDTFVIKTLPSYSKVSATSSLSWPTLSDMKKGQPHNGLTSCFLVAPTGFELATSALRGRPERKTLRNTSERFRCPEIFSCSRSLTVWNAPFGTIIDWILSRLLTAENRKHRRLQS